MVSIFDVRFAIEGQVFGVTTDNPDRRPPAPAVPASAGVCSDIAPRPSEVRRS